MIAEGLVIRTAVESDAPDIALACDDEAIRGFLRRLPVPYTEKDALDWIAQRPLVIVDPDTGRLLGSIGVTPAGRSGAAVGYWVAPWARGRGVATRATRGAAEWAFANGYDRVELLTDLRNTVSQRVALAAGFSHEGIRRGAGPLADGAWRDRVVWSRLPSDAGGPGPRDLPDLPGGSLSDGVVGLRPVTPDDTADRYALTTLPEVLATTVTAGPVTEESVALRCGRAGYQWLIGTAADMVITDDAGAHAGAIGLYYDARARQGMIGYSVGREFRGRGFARRAVRLIVDWSFDEVGVERLVAGTAPDNVGSQRALEAAGFQRETYERGRLPGKDGGPRIDVVGYAMLPSDR